MKVRNLFLSDLHLGSKHTKSKELLDFLIDIKKHHKVENLYLVGDTLDFWKIKRSWYWNDNCTLVIRKLLSFLRDGTNIFMIVGNHEDILREFIKEHNIEFGSIRLLDEVIHTTVNNRKILVIHGDKFDLATKYARWLCILGDIGYELLLNLNPIVNRIRQFFRLPKWSLSQAVKHNIKMAVNYVSDFEKYLVEYAKKKGCSGVICGHIHHASMKKLDDINYYNCGDFVESCTAIIEDYDGDFSLIKL